MKPPPLGELARRHLEQIKSHFEQEKPVSGAALSYRRTLAHYFNLIIPADATVLEIGCGSGALLELLNARKVTGVDISPAQIERARRRLPQGSFEVQAGETLDLGGRTFDYIIISDTLNMVADVQQLLERLHTAAHHETRIVINFHNSLWRPLLSVCRGLGLARRAPQSSWLSTYDVRALLALTGWDTIKTAPRILCPLPLLGLGTLVNRLLAPLAPWFCLSVFAVARRESRPAESLAVSVVIPARNESGNIENAVLRTPEMGTGTELIFVEGNSTDDTWTEIQRVERKYRGQRKIKIMQQSGRGKGNAVRDGFAVAEGQILMILDADLTMPPEELPKFYEAVATGRCDFANGSRLVYPMEGEAMKFLNLCANKAFSILFSWLLRQPIKDTLCGTKVLSATHYHQIVANRAYFGDFDPFGDFDLLFGADKLNLKIVDIPIRYRDRTYGETNIQRWKHGWLLLRMVVFAAKKLKFV
jgi:SAM-dependent methyltransferase